MSDLLRFQKIFIKALLVRARPDLQEGVRSSFRVWPQDIDINLHMTNSRYLKAMDLGRWDLFTQTGAIQHCFKAKWRIVVGSLKISYLKSLEPFESYQIWTRLVEWDERWLIFRQSFERDGRTLTDAYVRAAILGPKGKRISSVDALSAFGMSPEDIASGHRAAASSRKK